MWRPITLATLAICVLATGRLAWPAEPKPPAEKPQQKKLTRLIDKPRAEYEVTLGGTLDSFNTARYETLDGHHTIELAGFQPNLALSIENVGSQDVVNPRIVIGGRGDWFSLDTLVAEIVEPGMSDRQKALAVFQVFRDSFYHYNAPELYNQQGVLWSDTFDPIRHLNCYENTGCSCMAIGMATVWEHLGLKSRVVNFATSHWISEVFYDGSWHMLDADRKAFYLKPDRRTIAGIAELRADKDLIRRTHHQGFAAPASPDYDASRAGCYGLEPSGTPFQASKGHSMAITLRPGESIIRRWDNIGKFHDNWRHVDKLPRYANGKLVYRPDLSKGHLLQAAEQHHNLALLAADGKRPYVHGKRGSRTCELVLRVRSPYVMVGGKIRVEFACKPRGGTYPKVHVSFDGRNWRNLWHGPGGKPSTCDVSIDSFIGTRAMNAKYEYFVKIEFLPFADPTGMGIESLLIETDLEMSIPSLPTLQLGKNEVLYLDDTGGDRLVRVTHAWQESSANQPPSAPAAALSPEDAAKIASGAPTLRWKPAADADGDAIVDYHVEVRDEPEMRLTVSPNLERMTRSPKPEWKVPDGSLIEGKRYYWHVRARDKRGAWSRWSPVWSFLAGKQKDNTPGKPTGAAR